ncbi:MAG: C40 family peptidase [Sulfobacillus sp.]
MLLGFGPVALAAGLGDPILAPGTPDHAEVVVAQQDLQAIGYGIVANGQFGPATERAVISFQKQQGLSVNGLIDQETGNALTLAATSQQRRVSAPASTTLYTVSPSDSMASVAQTFHTTVAALLSLNSLPVPVLSPGEQLLIPATATTDTTAGASAIRATMVADALKQIGVPYHWGGTSPATGFDCSGLVQYVAGLAGISLPRTSSAQFQVGVPVPASALMPGDLLFFDTYGWATHVGIYIGGGQFVDAPDSGQQVHIQNLSNSYWSARFIGAKDVSGL